VLISKNVEIKVNGKKIPYYESLGYIIPKHKTKDGYCVKKDTKIIVDVNDIPKTSRVLVTIKCDYCGSEYNIRYDDYTNRKRKDINSDCCCNCKSIKNKELNLLRYGVENQFQREIIRHKIKQICLNRYGYEYPMQSELVKQKSLINMSKFNGIQSSKQQNYLNTIFNGEINFVDSSTKGFAIDIALIDDKIAIEYDGSGHRLSILFGDKTEDEFNLSEIRRTIILKRNGWKQIRIVSLNDYLPNKNILIEMLSFAKMYFNSGHSSITFDIDNSNVVVFKNKVPYNFEKLRKIKKDVKTCQ